MTQPLLIIKTKSGYAVAALPSGVLASIPIALHELSCFDDLGGRYSSGGVIDAIRDHFAKPADVTPLQSVA